MTQFEVESCPGCAEGWRIIGDQLCEECNHRHSNKLRDALKEAERFMSYFAGETGGTFVGPGTPQSCLKQIREALT